MRILTVALDTSSPQRGRGVNYRVRPVRSAPRMNWSLPVNNRRGGRVLEVRIQRGPQDGFEPLRNLERKSWKTVFLGSQAFVGRTATGHLVDSIRFATSCRYPKHFARPSWLRLFSSSNGGRSAGVPKPLFWLKCANFSVFSGDRSSLRTTASTLVNQKARGVTNRSSIPPGPRSRRPDPNDIIEDQVSTSDAASIPGQVLEITSPSIRLGSFAFRKNVSIKLAISCGRSYRQ